MRAPMRSLRLSSYVLFTSAVTMACGSAHNGASQAKVVNGQEVSAADATAKSTVALLTSYGQQFCSGTLLDKRHVLTAAHCAEGAQDGSFYVALALVAQAGGIDDAHLIAGTSFHANSAFNREAASRGIGSEPVNDVALVTMSADAPADYAPAPMLSRTDTLSVGQPVIVAGYGITSAGANGTNGVLRQTTSQITQLADAGAEFALGNSEGRACNGDSGGPAYVQSGDQLVVAGIVSRGESQCQGTVIYTDVRYFIDWINQA